MKDILDRVLPDISALGDVEFLNGFSVIDIVEIKRGFICKLGRMRRLVRQEK